MYKYGGFESNELYSHQNSLTGQTALWGDCSGMYFYVLSEEEGCVLPSFQQQQRGEPQKQRQNSFSHKV